MTTRTPFLITIVGQASWASPETQCAMPESRTLPRQLLISDEAATVANAAERGGD
jgi:hypothetical protein